jgi:hypothetical protein
MSDTCPRCLTEETRLEHEGKEQDKLVWRILHCVTCSYTWRDSEPASTVDPKTRDADFRVDPAKIDQLAVILAPVR